jgi:hypothetical protein
MSVLSMAEIDDARRCITRDGYAVFRDVVSKERLELLRDLLDDEYEAARTSGTLFGGGGSISGHLNCFPGASARFVHDDVRDRGIIDVVRALKPDATEQMRVTMNFNLPHSVAQHYHADGLFAEQFLICNVAVVDTDVSNGAMDVLPGTHTEFVKFWRYSLDRTYRRTTRVPLRQGDALLRLSTLWHRGMPNHTDRPRPLMSLTFGEKSVPTGDPFLVNEGKVLFYPNWYSTSRLGQLRERAYVAAPWSYSIYRFLRSLHGEKGNTSW